MPDYRLYRLDGVGKFTTVHEIVAGNDGEALKQAREMKLAVSFGESPPRGARPLN